MYHIAEKIPPKALKLQHGLNLRANSLLVTLYGDALAAKHAEIKVLAGVRDPANEKAKALKVGPSITLVQVCN